MKPWLESQACHAGKVELIWSEPPARSSVQKTRHKVRWHQVAVQPRCDETHLGGRRDRGRARCSQRPRPKSGPRGGKAIQGRLRTVRARAELSCLGVSGGGETRLPVGTCPIGYNGGEKPPEARLCVDQAQPRGAVAAWSRRALAHVPCGQPAGRTPRLTHHLPSLMPKSQSRLFIGGKSLFIGGKNLSIHT